MPEGAGMVQWSPSVRIGNVNVGFGGQYHIQHLRILGFVSMRDGVVDGRYPVNGGLPIDRVAAVNEQLKAFLVAVLGRVF